ncbi:MAG: UDP-3-O-acyl-N-acetylglucosamine deacetylase [Planctomycetes bacterium]|nr:UDP-3-O-acyl-N-acetylglucosamine deacetylase [Planctomycetota bacterium]
MARKQRTTREPFAFSGAGLHTGAVANVRVSPAEEGHGVVFVRTDLPDRPRLPADVDYVDSRGRRTTIRAGGADVQTIEHLLAACNAMKIDNLLVEMDAPEMPGLDGSSLPFVDMIRGAKPVEQQRDRKQFQLVTPISVGDPGGDSSIVALPAEQGLHFSYTLDYPQSPYVGSQYHSLRLDENAFANEIAPARTFVMQEEATALRAAGLGKGATYENTLVFGDRGVVENRLRFPDEPVRHKLLDLIGDFFLLNLDLSARIVATKAGHALNAAIVREILKHVREFEIGEGLRKDSTIEIREIMRILPHRYPFLLIDRVIELEGMKRAVGLKNVTINEPFFQGHWPSAPIMPGVLIVEAMAQLAGVLLLRKFENTGKLAVLLSIDKVKLRRSVVPGDQLRIEVEALKVRSRSARVHCRATVEGKLACEAQINFMLADA